MVIGNHRVRRNIVFAPNIVFFMLSFDRNGIILSLKRYGATATAPQDNLSYTYTGNKLMQLNSWEYAYDANGNMTSDGRRHLQLSWNHLNLPATISNNEDDDATVNYTYLADGTKVLAQAPGTSEGYAYLGTMVYKLNNGTWTLETTPFTGGRFIKNATGAFVEQRHITDHLGSTRTIVEGDNYTEVEQNDYYPFGKRIADNTLPTTPTNRWRFSGKEIQTLGGIDLIDFGARMYDDAIVRWPTQDAMADTYLWLSPYGYCAENPISNIDNNGDWIGNVISALIEYGFQVYKNYQDGLSGADAWINNIDIADVALAAINPVGKLAVVKTLAINIAKEAVDVSLSGDVSVSADAKTLETAAVNTLIDTGVGKASAAGKHFAETAKKEVKEASSTAIKKTNISKNRPKSTKRAKAAEDAKSALQVAREKEVAGEIITKTAPATDPLIKKSAEKKYEKKNHSKE